jgi:hypothetical protein
LVKSITADLAMQTEREGGRGLKSVPCILTENPHSAAVFSDERNHNNPPAIVFSRSLHATSSCCPRLKTGLKGHCFVFIKEIQQNVTAGLTAILKENLKRCFKQWHNSWNTCIYAEGQYFKHAYPFYYKLCLSSGNVLILSCTWRSTRVAVHIK